MGHRYRKWTIDEKLSVIVRCQVDAAMENKGEKILVSVKALNEFDSRVTGVDWRLKLENQRGAVLATELKNNNCKLAKWTAAALLGGIDQMKVGFVSRTHPRDSRNHQVLGVQFYRPHEFAMQINLAAGNMWAILRHVVEVIDKCADGKYLMLKDPNKPLLRLYEVPMSSFEDEDDSDDDDDEEDDAGDIDDDKLARPPAHLRLLTAKRVAEHASQNSWDPFHALGQSHSS